MWRSIARFRWRAPYFRSVPSLQQELARGLSNAEQETALGRLEHALLHHSQLDLENLLQLL